MVKIKEAIIVEGRYDKNTLSQVVDTVIIETKGFHIFSDREGMELIRRINRHRGVIIMTDGDAAGFLIRNHLKGSLDSGVKHAYIPDVYAKERRKRRPSKEGKLGVEGMPPEEIIRSLKLAGATFEGQAEESREARITKADLYELGLSGGEKSSEKRRSILKELKLPERLSANSLLDVLNALYKPQELYEICRNLR